MTQAEYRKRIERGFRCCEFGYGNPFREQLRERLETARAEHRREVAEAKSEAACAF